MRPRTRFALLALLFVLATPALAKRRRGPEVVEEADGDLIHLHLKEDPGAQGWLYKPRADEQETKEFDLIVGLHGAGGNPKNFLMRRIMEERGAWCLAVAGRHEVKTPRGRGFNWDTSGRSYIADLTRHLVENHPIRKDRVIVWGHSAGGTMTLEALAHAPELFAGGLATAAPAQPSSRHSDCRVVVFLGDKDPNWGGAASVRSYVEKLQRKRRKGACAFLAVQGLGHDVPAREYLCLGFDWIQHGKARGGEATVPTEPKGAEGELRMILVRHRGCEGAGKVRRSKGRAAKTLKKIKRELDRGRAYFPFEAACHSEDEETASCGGGIDPDDLEEHGLTAPDLKEGETSAILEGKQGLYLIHRE